VRPLLLLYPYTYTASGRGNEQLLGMSKLAVVANSCLSWVLARYAALPCATDRHLTHASLEAPSSTPEDMLC
jgi:hypothetical protein